MILDRLPGPIRRLLFAGGTRQDRLRDPDLVIAVLDLVPGMIVGDLGPGAGHFTLRMARAVEPNGVVYALDASRATLDDLQRAAEDRGITTLRAVPVRRDRLEIPEPVDLLFVSATYHHLPDPTTYFAEARTSLRPGGRLAILESRREGLLPRWRGRHATSPRRILREMTAAGYRLIATHDVVRGYWFGLLLACPQDDVGTGRGGCEARPEVSAVRRDGVRPRAGPARFPVGNDDPQARVADLPPMRARPPVLGGSRHLGFRLRARRERGIGEPALAL